MNGYITNRYAILGVLTLLNLLNYVDRYVPSGALGLIGEEFVLTEFEKGIIHFSFLLVYTLLAPVVAFYGDRVNRMKWICFTGLLWSMATTGAFFAPNYYFLLSTRAIVGIGEAVFGVLSATIILDLFGKDRRGFMLSILFLAIPVGSAIGYIVGGSVGTALSWRWAFLVVGIPGFIVSSVVYFLEEPPRGQYDEGYNPMASMSRGSFSIRDITSLLGNPTWVLLVLGLACASWVQGGLSWWVPDFYDGWTSFQLEEVTLRFGAVTALGGLVAIPLGGYLSDSLRSYTDRSPAIVSATGMILGALPAYFAITYLVEPYMWICAFIVIVGLFLNLGPINQAVMEVVPVHRRAASVAFCLFFMHALGDVISPPLIGWISDHYNLQRAMLMTIPWMLAGGVFWFACSLYLPDATEQALEQSKSE